MKYKNIIFDLGAVLFDLNYQLTKDAFIKLGLKNFDAVFSKYNQQHFFDQYEKGMITNDEFRSRVREYLSDQVSDQMIDDAWNAMLLGVPLHRYSWLSEISQKHRIFLLSNTNELHINSVRDYINRDFGWDRFRDLFENVYLSCEIGMRKPDVEIFEHVIQENNLIKTETLFIDDSPQHIKGAKVAGIEALHLEDGKTIEEMFSNNVC